MELQSTANETFSFDNLPDTCPFCFRTITPFAITCHLVAERELEVYFICNSRYCNKSFIGYYANYGGRFEFIRSSFGNRRTKTFTETISNISLTFQTIYNEAFFAEQNELLQICGGGYRKAVEFLIKDYAIQYNPDKKKSIEKNTLASCISLYVSDENIKAVAKRASWLGNDETHYVRKWGTKDLEDLKILIDLTLHWIEMEHLTSTFKKDMPD